MLPVAPLFALLGLAVAPDAAVGSPFDKADALADCLSKRSVPTDGLGSNDWKLDAAPFNLQLNYTPISIVVPTTAKHVQDAVACAAKFGVKANAKCGGHSYASFGLGGEDGHLTIEMDRMNKVTLDNSTGIAVIEGGSRLGHVASELYNQGKRAFSHGTCPGVGVGGHALHGGYGVSSHTKGLALDWMVGATVVLANSTLVNCSATENPDLFWALRGAGGSMGVVTSFQFNTFKVPDTLTFFALAVQWPTQERALVGVQAVQDFAQTMPSELNMRLMITKSFVNLEGLYYGDKAGLQAALAPLTAKTNGTMALIQQGGWLDQVKHFGNGMALDQGHPYDYHETFYSSSLYTNALNAAQMKSFVNYWFQNAKPNKRDWYVQIDLHGGNTSAVSVPATDSTSYMHRDFLLMYSFYDRVDKGAYPADGFALMQNFVSNITSSMADSDWGMYVNYPDPKMGQKTAQVNYWGTHLPRLQSIKKAVDPTDVFHYPQGVVPA
ncbi:putative FAD-linked oxidoreductase YvdP [Diplogelasinospora grovesii]|uniref:FAD-linked oxidoreductase YvdP n=1 Tax=Diplogelasinospora grovesii TaxID=303347 RepID=A0AAN6S1L2_9PEZI|nr:putative FAD-linked oxidoreductase YvdP [Diplogelasinospora grovesii]